LLFNFKLFIFAPAIYGEIAQLVRASRSYIGKVLGSLNRKNGAPTDRGSWLERPDHISGRFWDHWI